jgi:hypothetical protein
VNPENEKDVLKISITVPNVTFDENRLQEKYGQFSKDKVNFVNDLKSFVLSHSVEALRKKVQEGQGTIKFKLNDQVVELNYKEDFFLSGLEAYEN